MTAKLLIHSNDVPQSLEIYEQIIASIQNRDIELLDEDSPLADYIISVGGDGTILSTFHNYIHHLDTAKFIGIHTGHLGFYTDWVQEDIETILDHIENNHEGFVSYPLLNIEIELDTGEVRQRLALNEFTYRSSIGTTVLEVSVKDEFFETFRGDGVCISTPTGSTGLNKSLGGAVIHPRIDVIQLTEMASINNRVYRTLGSPMVIPRDEWFELIPSGGKTGFVTIDNLNWQNINIKKITCRVAQQRIKFANFKHTHFWDRVEKAFIGVNETR